MTTAALIRTSSRLGLPVEAKSSSAASNLQKRPRTFLRSSLRLTTLRTKASMSEKRKRRR